MMPFEKIGKLYLVTGVTDLRKGIDGYAALIQSQLHQRPMDNSIYNKVRNAARAQASRDVEQMKKEFCEAEKAEKATAKKKSEELKKAYKELASLPVKGRPSKRKKEFLAYIHQLEQEDNEDAAQISESEYQAAVEELAGMPKQSKEPNMHWA